MAVAIKLSDEQYCVSYAQENYALSVRNGCVMITEGDPRCSSSVARDLYIIIHTVVSVGGVAVDSPFRR